MGTLDLLLKKTMITQFTKKFNKFLILHKSIKQYF